VIGVLTLQTLEEQPLSDEIILRRLMAFQTFPGAGEEKMMKSLPVMIMSTEWAEIIYPGSESVKH
jgi:hypothetical protein